MIASEFFFNFSSIPQDQLSWFEDFIKLIIDPVSFSIRPKKAPEAWFVRHKRVDDWNRFQQLTPHIEHYSFGDKIKCLLQGYWDEAPKCKCCGNNVLLVDQLPYNPRPFCSRQCSARFEGSKKKSKETSLRKYGVDNYTKTDEFKNDYKSIIQEKYGVDNASQADEIKQKKRDTLMKNYGISYPLQSPVIQEKYKSTIRIKYGVDNIQQNNEIKAKTNATVLERYGVTSMNHIHVSKETLEKIDSYNWMNEQYNEKRLSAATIATLLGDVTYQTVLDRCRRFGFEINYNFSSSSQEYLVLNFLRELLPGVDIKTNVRNVLPSKRELDIYIPDRNFAIEVNGLYWHSFYPPTYHQEKKIEAIECGIDLIMVTDRDIDDPVKFSKIQSVIRARLGLNTQKIMARNTSVEILQANDARKFLDDNHLQGFTSAEFYYSLKYEGTVVMVASFGKPRFDASRFSYELIRLASKSGVSVTGGFKKLLSAFRKTHPESIMSYIDLDYFNGISFQDWTFVKYTSPGYFWTDGTKCLSRYQTQKHKLKGLLGDTFNPELSEAQNMRLAGFNQYYNSGNAVYSLA